MVCLSSALCWFLSQSHRVQRIHFESNMAESAPAAAPAKSPRKRATKPKKAGPSAADLVLKAVTASKERKGISYVALKKELAVKGIDNAN
nr:histone H1-like [Pseudochaenichthys georgianus]